MTERMANLDGVLDIWSGGQLLAFSGVDGPTDYLDALAIRVAFEDTALEVLLPGSCRLDFGPEEPTDVQLGGDFFSLHLAGQEVRGAFVDDRHFLVEGPCTPGRPGRNIIVMQKDARTMIGAVEGFDASRIDADLDAVIAARRQWVSSLALPAGLAAPRRRAMAKAVSQLKTMLYAPEGRFHHRWTTPDRWPHRNLWLWDSAFHAVGLRHLDAGLAQEAIEAVLDCQADDGFIAHMHTPDTSSDVTQPPVLAMGAKLVYETQPDRLFLERIYPGLCRYVEWDFAHRDVDGAGLLEWKTASDPNCRCDESGMDNCSRFDTAEPIDAVDFNAFIASECEILAEFASLLGRDEDEQRWRAEHERLCDLINDRMWNEDKGLYMDSIAASGEQSGVLASCGFLPLICGAPSEARARRLAAHLENPETFGTAFAVPTIAACETEHYAKDMWRGPVWININWLIARGLDRYGLGDAARKLRRDTLAEQERQYERYGTFFEFYDDRKEVDPPQLMRKGKCAPDVSPYHQVFFDYGWSAALYLDLAWTG